MGSSSKTDNNPLFHYTDAQALCSILEKQELWLSDIRYMNDHSEFNHGIDVIKKLIKKHHGDEAVGKFEWVADIGKDHLIGACSFSKKKNLLSQWRGYCPNGGYSIEFDRVELESVMEANSCTLNDCAYEEDEKKKVANECVETIKLMSKIDRGFIYELLLGNFWRPIAQIKNEDFIEEKESRIIYSQQPANFCYRVRNELIIPYYKVKFPAKAIKKIMIGPMQNQELAEKSLCRFLRCLFDTGQLGDCESIEIECSDIPYRVFK